MKVIADLVKQVADLQRRVSGMVRHGTVAEVDAKKGTVRLRIGGTDEKPFLSPAVSYAQIGGALKVHTPPSVGQQMTIIGAGGDWRQGIALPMTWSDQNKSPSEKGDEHVLTFGDVSVTIKGSSLKVAVGGTSFEIAGGGIKAVADDYQFD